MLPTRHVIQKVISKSLHFFVKERRILVCFLLVVCCGYGVFLQRRTIYIAVSNSCGISRRPWWKFLRLVTGLLRLKWLKKSNR